MSTLSDVYRYDTIYFNKPLTEWVSIIHDKIKIKYNCDFDIYEQSYGYDNYVYLLSSILSYLSQNSDDIFIYISKQLDLDIYIHIAHKAWMKNYTYYKENVTYDESVDPCKKIMLYKNKDKYKADISNSKHNKLPSYQKDIYVDVITYVFDVLVGIVVSEGMKNLKI